MNYVRRRLNKLEQQAASGCARNRVSGQFASTNAVASVPAALEQGVEGGKWFRLFDKVFAERNLLAAFQQVARKKGAAGVDHVTTAEFGRAIPENIWQLSDALRDGTFRPQAIRRVHIPKPGTKETRPLGL